MCIFKPELCTAHLNIEKKNLKKEKKFELQKHIIYLSITSNLKIGITIKKNFIIRLMDQGATIAIKIAQTPNRYLSGIIEKLCKNIINDKTNFNKMLINNFNKKKFLLLILKKKKKIKKLLINNNYYKFFIENNKIYKFYYPIKKYPKKIKNIQLNKYKIIKSKLNGIKGQYLIFKNNNVLNIRNHMGNIIDINIL
ncbi:MAG: DUF2797 domain-containing protein [Candidatus Shikimatogenerans bostrichidophilus]|nr:MAG: DUF2797 domain-containing protein [Candidatus Shikimatogenerans bostrichidophilus]